MSQLKLTSLEATPQKLDGGAMFGNAPKPLWEKWIPADERNRIPLACRCLLVQTESHNILCETGIGSYLEPKLRDRFGVIDEEAILLKQLAELGIKEEEIDFVILSHLHFDHAGGLVPPWPAASKPDWQLHFPKARYLVGKEHFERSTHPHFRDRASFIPLLADKLKESDRLVLIDSAGDNPIHELGIPELKDTLSFYTSHGHTPGHLHALFKGEKGKVFFTGDLIPGTPWVHIPIHMGYDRNSELLVDEKTAILPEAVKEDWLLFFTHDPYQAASHVEQDEKKRYHATNTIKDLKGFLL